MLLLTLDSALLCSKNFGFARKMLGFARKFFQELCSRSLGSKLYARNARSKIVIKTLLGIIKHISTFWVVKVRNVYGFHNFVRSSYKRFQIN